jgi:metal-sulfur cluster biosynthetic enzyme
LRQSRELVILRMPHTEYMVMSDDHTNENPAPEGDVPSSPTSQASVPPGSGAAFSELTLEQVKLALRKVKDPDLNIVDLGLVYDVRLIGTDVEVDMSLTSPGCPSGPEIMGDAERILKALPGVGAVTINLVWTPFWSPDRIEPRVRAYMGL